MSCARCPFERRDAADGQRHIGEHGRPAAAEPQAFHFLHAGHLLDGRGDFVVQRTRHAVEQIVHRLLAQPHADRNDDHGHAEGGHGIGVNQPRRAPGPALAGQDAAEAQQYDRG
jgi:hypothetical protein